MRRPKLILAAVVLGASSVLPAAPPAQAAGCSMGANPTPFNTCTAPIPCSPATVTVKVNMTGSGQVLGWAWCGNNVTCTAAGPPAASCSAVGPGTGGVVMRCGAYLSGVVITWQVGCSNP